MIFLSTLSLRRATLKALIEKRNDNLFSIHALLAESDHLPQRNSGPPAQFSIHALLAESDLAGRKLVKANTGFSIHALLAESDYGM